jgi:phage baseplate assembly protein gpV
MEHTERAIGLEQIQLISPYGSVQLTNFRISSKPNQHTRVSFCGMVDETQKDSCIEKAGTQDQIEINLTDAGQKVQTLFKGVVTQISVKTVRGIYYLEVEALSNTYLLDLKLKNRSFQNLQMSYNELFQKVLADYSKGSFTDRTTQGAKLQGVIIQFKETDWTLLVRAASQLGRVLIPDHTADSPRFWIGVPEGPERQITNAHYILEKNLAEYRISSQNFTTGKAEIDFAGFRVESNQVLDIGDQVQFQGVNLVIAQVMGAFQQGVLKYEYLLTRKDALRQNKIVNQQLSGVSLHGKVIDRRQDQVRIHLEMDKDQNKEEAYWFKVVTSYTTEGNSGWYCMPEPGDRVRLYLSNCQEESATVLGGLRVSGATNPKTSDPRIKFFGNTHGKELKMDARELRFTAKESQTGKMFIKLDVEEGVEIQSDQKIQVESNNDIVWDAKTIAIDAQQGVYLACNESSIIIDNRRVDIKAEMVRVEGLEQAQSGADSNLAEESSSDESGQEETNSDTVQDSHQSEEDETGYDTDEDSEIEPEDIDYDSDQGFE